MKTGTGFILAQKLSNAERRSKTKERRFPIFPLKF